MRATKVNAGLAESNGKLLLGIWRDSLHVTCGLTACTSGSAPGPTLGNEYGKTLPFYFYKQLCSEISLTVREIRGARVPQSVLKKKRKVTVGTSKNSNSMGGKDLQKRKVLSRE